MRNPTRSVWADTPSSLTRTLHPRTLLAARQRAPARQPRDMLRGALLASMVMALCAATPVHAQSSSPARDAGEAGTIRWEPYETMGSDGQPLVGELGRLRVPEDRARPGGPEIELAFVRFRTANPEPGPTMVFLAGGPGASGVEWCVGPATGRLVRLLDTCDVIGLDQRGTGRSVPNLSEGPSFEYALPLDEPATRDALIEAYSEAVERCAAYWQEQDVDLAAYHTEASADDLDDLRAALGLEQVALWGASYGTHLGIAYLRRHPEHAARAVLSRIEGPDHTLKLPSTTQRALERLGELVRADPGVGEALPDLVGTVRELLETLERESPRVTLEHDGETLRLVLGPFDLQSHIANTLGLAFELAGLPAALQRMTQGDWSDLAPGALDLRRGEVGSAMALAMDCASGATKDRLRRIGRETRDAANLLADAVNVPYPKACRACGDLDLGDDFRAPFPCDVPMLLVSGDLDARTPPSNAEELLGGFPNAVHVLVRNAGHEPIEVLAPEYRELLQAFLRGERVESRTVELPAPRFAPWDGP